MTITLNGTTGVTTPDVSTTTETISGGTANGVQYLNGSKAVTTGTALTFDGTNLATTGSVSTPSTFGFKNRIINGGMVINQRATSVTDAAYVTDRWQYANSVASKATVSQDTSVYLDIVHCYIHLMDIDSAIKYFKIGIENNYWIDTHNENNELKKLYIRAGESFYYENLKKDKELKILKKNKEFKEIMKSISTAL